VDQLLLTFSLAQASKKSLEFEVSPLFLIQGGL
jgi:hypothetical protein